MKISVIVPAHNEENYLPNCLKNLLSQKEKPYEIIVVDNASTDKTPEIARKFGVKVIFEEKKGVSFARNQGFEQARGEIIARVDADTKPPKDWIFNIKQHFKKNPQTLALTGPIVFYDLPFKSTLFSKTYLKASKIISGFYYLIGPNMILKKKAWEKVKDEVCLDDSKVHEDIDLSIHLAKKGIEIIYDPKIVNFISGRKIKYKPWSFFFEYPIRFIKTLKNH